MGNSYPSSSHVETLENEITLQTTPCRCLEVCRLLVSIVDIIAISPPEKSPCYIWISDSSNRVANMVKSGLFTPETQLLEKPLKKGERKIVNQTDHLTFLSALKWHEHLKQRYQMNIIAISAPSHLGPKYVYISS